MGDTWTTQQILALAPDPASAKAGQDLAGPGKWVTLGQSDAAVWGECQGSGVNPYQVTIDLGEPAFKCSCPSRKFPCKHGIGLFLLYANNRPALTQKEAPPWASEWLSKRGEKFEKQKQAVTQERAVTEADAAKAAADLEKRAAQREKKVRQGLNELEMWLRDLVRNGLASIQARPYSFWDEPAARLIDAQAPGLARTIKEMASIPRSGAGWQERMVERLGFVTLLLEAYRRLGDLPEPVQADVRDTIGWNVRQETVLAGSGLRDLWMVLGQRAYDEEQIRVSRTWLRGRESGRDALILQFTRPGQPIETVIAPGTAFEAELAFFPGAWPLRALIKERSSAIRTLNAFPAYDGAEAMLSQFATALGSNPWVSVFPAPVGPVVPVSAGEGWSLADSSGRQIPIGRDFENGWKLLAISGGHPLHLFGEWDGTSLLPLSVWANGRLIPLT